MSESLVIIGNGMAAARLVDELSRRALGRYAIAIVGEERGFAYNRVLLSPFLGGEIAESELDLKPKRFWADKGVTLKTGCKAVSIDREAQKVQLADGSELSYDKLVLATGASPVRLPLPGVELPGVVAFRDKGDVARMLIAASRKVASVVIGGGLLGIEAAVGLALNGANVTLVHRSGVLMERQLDAKAGAMLKAALEARGVRVELKAESERVLGESQAEGVELADGRKIEAGLIVLAAGISPRINLARDAGLATHRGIVVDDCLATSDPAIFALGECAEHRGTCYGLVEPAYEQAAVLASRLCDETADYEGTVLATNLKVSGVPVFSCGDFVGGAGSETLVAEDARQGLYRKLVMREGRLVGALLFGETQDALFYRDLIRSGDRIGARRAGLIFGRAYAEAA